MCSVCSAYRLFLLALLRARDHRRKNWYAGPDSLVSALKSEQSTQRGKEGPSICSVAIRFLTRTIRLVPLLCVMLLLAGCVPPTCVDQKAAVDFAGLDPIQQGLFNASPVSKLKSWGALTLCEQLEFAGATQALGDYYRQRVALLNLTNPPALEQVVTVTAINGSIPASPSQDQFNLEVGWGSSAALLFAHDHAHWWPHLAWLHPTQFGYTQIKYYDPFLGLVVLFDKDNHTTGQTHMDFRDFPFHYFAPNGDVASNYDYYCNWYQPLRGYSINCPSSITLSKLPQTDENRETSASNEPEEVQKGGFELLAQVNVQTEMQRCSTFLSAWYVEATFQKFMQYVATDNLFSPQALAAMKKAGIQTIPWDHGTKAWRKVFDGAFTSPPTRRQRITSIDQAVGLGAPAPPPERSALSFLNADANGKVNAAFGLLSPASAPPGSLFPPLTLSQEQRKHFDAIAWYLDYLNRTYAQNGNLYVVGYGTKGSGLRREGVVQYWIHTGGKWSLAMLHGTD